MSSKPLKPFGGIVPVFAPVFFVLPAAALLADSWLLAALDLVLYGVFKALIPREYAECREAFGEDYVRYENSVSEIVPAFWKLYRQEETHE